MVRVMTAESVIHWTLPSYAMPSSGLTKKFTDLKLKKDSFVQMSGALISHTSFELQNQKTIKTD